MSFAMTAALASKGNVYTIFDKGNVRNLTFIGYYTGEEPAAEGVDLSPGSYIDLGFTGNTEGQDANYTFSRGLIRSKVDMTPWSKMEVTFYSSQNGYIQFIRTDEQPTAGAVLSSYTNIRSVAFNAGTNTKVFDTPDLNTYIGFRINISKAYEDLDFRISKWRLLK